jgi:hypothetical protein
MFRDLQKHTSCMALTTYHNIPTALISSWQQLEVNIKHYPTYYFSVTRLAVTGKLGHDVVYLNKTSKRRTRPQKKRGTQKQRKKEKEKPKEKGRRKERKSRCRT